MKSGRRIKGGPPIAREALRVAVLVLVLAVATCVPVRIPPVPAPPAPFVRYPYLHAVTDSSAYVLWTTSTAGRDTLVYWIEETGDTARLATSGAKRRRRVRLGPLPSDSRIGYRLVTAPPRRVTPDHRFQPGARKEVTALVFGDSGTGSRARADFAAATALSFHFVILRVEGSRMALEAIDRQGNRIDRHELRPVPPAAAATLDSPGRGPARSRRSGTR